MFNRYMRVSWLVFLLLVCVLAVAVSASDSINRVKRFGGEGDPAKGGTNYISDAYFAKNGDVYLVDNTNHKVLRYNANGKFISSFGVPGVANGQLWYPYRVAVDGQGNIFVEDYHELNMVRSPNDKKEGYYRVQKFNQNGKFIWTVGRYGKGPGEFISSCPDIDVDEKGNLYVLDRYNYRIQKFSPDGKFIAAWGSFGKGPGQFDFPTSLVIDKKGDIYVTDTNNHRVQKFDQSGNFLLSFGSEGYNDGQMKSPYYLYVDKNNHICVVNEFSFYTSNKRRLVRFTVQKFDTKGNYLSRFFASDRFYDDDTSYSYSFLNVNRDDNLFAYHSRDKAVDQFKTSYRLVNFNTMSKNYYLELRKPTELYQYTYDYTTYYTEYMRNLDSVYPSQTISLYYDMDDRTAVSMSNNLTMTNYNGILRNINTSGTSYTMDATRTTIYNNSNVSYNYYFDKTKNKNITCNVGYNFSMDQYDYKNGYKENDKYSGEQVYGNVNMDVADFQDVEVGYYKNDGLYNNYYDYGTPYTYDYTSGSNYYYVKYHADF